jgi:FMN-dependent oxidoreductase (nitrilotriacetate monooxygenase family)
VTAKRFHLAWFLNQGYGPGTWQSPWRGSIGQRWLSGDYYADFARALEAACFDYVLIEDSSYVSDVYAGTRDVYLRAGYSTPKLESTALAGKLAHHTERLGLVATLSTTEWNPYLLARHVQSMDHVTGGRMGWNIVTGGSPIAARNFGNAERIPHAERYTRAHEFAELVTKLWDTWEPDALITDLDSHSLVDPAKVHEIEFEGTYFSSRGPLNVPRSPQGRPVIAQAGASEAGRRFGGTYADTIVASTKGGAPAYKSYRDSVRAEAAAAGRDPDDVKVMFVVTPYLAETEEEAQAFFARRCDQRRAEPETWLAFLSTVTGVDFSTFDPDEPIGAFAETIDSEFIRSTIDKVFRGNGDKTLRQLAVEDLEHSSYVGTPASVADQMEATMEEAGGDGFLFELNQMHLFDGRAISSVLDGLVPELQRRGVVRTEYEFELFRDNLTAF